MGWPSLTLVTIPLRFEAQAMLDPIQKLKLQIEFMNAGIVPMSWSINGGAPPYFDINKILASVPPDEARAMKRKFRKLWRAATKKKLNHGGREGKKLADEVGMGSPQARRGQKNARKSYVLRTITKKIKVDVLV